MIKIKIKQKGGQCNMHNDAIHSYMLVCVFPLKPFLEIAIPSASSLQTRRKGQNAPTVHHICVKYVRAVSAVSFLPAAKYPPKDKVRKLRHHR
jgi:hypothetical protein